MSTPVAILVTAVGALLILTALRDVFDTLFNPGGKAVISKRIMRALWGLAKLAGKRQRHAISVAGPLTLIAIIGSWALSLIVGWALVYWPHMPEGFLFEPGAEHGGLGGLVDAVYLSIVTLATLGFGDVTPDAAALRLTSPFEALLGFGLLTASISWIGSIYPAVQRHRSLAYEICVLREAQAEAEIELGALDADSAEAVYGDLVSRVVASERDLVAYPIAYYFDHADDRFALSAAMPYVWKLALQGADPESHARARLRAMMLRDAVADFGRTAAHRFHGDTSGEVDDLLEAYARDHARTPEQTLSPP